MNVQKRNGIPIYCLSAGATLPEWLGDHARRNLSKTNESVRRRIELLQDFQMPSSSSKLVQSSGDGRYILAAGTYPPRIRCYDVHDLAMKFERYTTSAVIDMVTLGEDYGKLALLQDDRTIAFHAHYGHHESSRIPTFGRAMAYEPSTCELLVASSANRIYRINLEEGRFSEPWQFENTKNSGSATAAAASSSAAGTSIAVHPHHPLCSVGCDDGTVRFWDNRAPDTLLRPFLSLDVATAVDGYGYYDDGDEHYMNRGLYREITSLAHDPSSGLHMAVGTGGGLVALYDIRSSRPLYVQEHKLGLPIHSLQFHTGSGMVLSADEKIIKVWRYRTASSEPISNLDTTAITTATRSSSVGNDDNNNSNDPNAIGALKVNIEGTGKLTHCILAGDENDPSGHRTSGLILCATDQPKMDSFFVPAIGVAPKWCSFLESITEELEERDLKQRNTGDLDAQRERVFENYKFVSRDDLEALGVSNLIGTPLLRGYMHGFFMDTNLYNRVKAVANPFEYEEYRKKKLKERIDAKQSSRIAPRSDSKKKKKAAVNPSLAERLEHKAENANKASGKVAKDLLSDDRFGSLFTNPDFEIDEEEEDFKLRNPSGVAAMKRRKDNMDSDEDADDVSDEDETDRDIPLGEQAEQRGDGQEAEDDDDEALASDNSDDDEDGFAGGKVRGEAYEEMKEIQRRHKQQRKQDVKKSRRTAERTKKTATVMHEDEDVIGGDAADILFSNSGESELARKRREELNMPLAMRRSMRAEEEEEESGRPQSRLVEGGAKEFTFIPKDIKRKMEEEKSKREEGRGRSGKRNRRGVKELGLRTPFRNYK